MAEAAESSGKRPPIAILIAVSAIGPLALNIFVPSMPRLAQDLGVDYAAVQLTLTLYLIGMAVCQLFYGPLSDRFGRRPVLLAGLALFVVATFAAAIAPSIEALIAARLLQAIGGSSGIVLSRAIVRDLYSRERAASILGYITMAWAVAPMVAPALGGFLDETFGWRSSFFLLVALGAATLLASFFHLHETHRPGPLRGGGGARELLGACSFLLRQRSFLGFTFTLGCTSSVFFSFLAGAPYVTVNLLGLTALDYGFWFVLVSLGYMAGNGIAGRWSERVGVERMILLGTLLALFGTTIAAAAAFTGWLSAPSLFLPMVLVAMGNGAAIPNGLAGAISIRPAIAGTASGVAGFLQIGTGALTSQSVGLLQDGEPLALFPIMFAGSLAAVLLHLLLHRRKERRSASEPASSA